MTLEALRARDARDKVAFFAGVTDRHPHGESGKRWILPPETGKGCWDTHPGAVRFSEWGRASGAEGCGQ